ncbi:MAG TPA: OsmC family peroxiredoxin [Solirubrobacteraceae bacterium]|jgi:osmotically inducible protein OsmC
MSDEETATTAGAESETEALHSAAVAWAGPLLGGGSGSVTLDSGAAPAELALTWESRTELPGGRTSPEELISAGLASCFTMMLAHLLAQDGHPVQSLHTEARAAKRIGGNFAIKRIELQVSGEVEGIDEQTFRDTAAIARRDCPAANALSGTEISLTAELL